MVTRWTHVPSLIVRFGVSVFLKIKMIKRKKWTKEEIKFLKENYKMMFFLDIAKNLKRTLGSVESKARELNLKPGHRSRSSLNQSGSKNHNWKGGISKNHYHYKKIQLKRCPNKYRAGNLLRYAVKNGKIKKPKQCERCSKKTKLEGHHEDYDYPLKVIWLCRKCHILEHKKLSLLFSGGKTL